MATKKAPVAANPQVALPLAAFNLHEFLESAGVARRIAKYAPRVRVFSQGDAATDVFYLRQGSVKLSVLSRTGKEAVVAILGPGDFLARDVSRDSPGGWPPPTR